MSLYRLYSDYLIKHICGRSRNHSSLPPRISNLAEGAMIPGAWDTLIFIPYNHSPEKRHILALKSLLLPQFSTYRHRTGFIVMRIQVHIANYLGLPIKW